MSSNIPPESYIKKSEERLETLYKKLFDFEDELTITADVARKSECESKIEKLHQQIETLESKIKRWRSEVPERARGNAPGDQSLFLSFFIQPISPKAKNFTLQAWRCGDKDNWKPLEGVPDASQPFQGIRAKIAEIISRERSQWNPNFSIEIILPETLFFSDFRKLSAKNGAAGTPFAVMDHNPFMLRWLHRFSLRMDKSDDAPWREKSKGINQTATHSHHIIFADESPRFDCVHFCQRITSTEVGICVGFGFKPKSSKHLCSILATGTPVALWPLRDLQPDEIAELKSLPQPDRLKTLPKALQERRYQAMCERRSDHWSHSVVLLYDDYDRVPPGHDKPLETPT